MTLMTWSSMQGCCDPSAARPVPLRTTYGRVSESEDSSKVDETERSSEHASGKTGLRKVCYFCCCSCCSLLLLLGSFLMFRSVRANRAAAPDILYAEWLAQPRANDEAIITSLYGTGIGLPYPTFELKRFGYDKTIWNTDWEYDDQKLIFKYVRPTDSGLMLGGNIGGACIAMNIVLQNRSRQACVEPNPVMISTLEANRKSSNAKFRVVQGVITKQESISFQKSSCHACSTTAGFNNPFGELVEVPGWDLYGLQEEIFGNSLVISQFSYVHVDCEGCLCSFLEEYSDILYHVRGISVELDLPELCDYMYWHVRFLKLGFRLVEMSRDPWWFRAVWLRF